MNTGNKKSRILADPIDVIFSTTALGEIKPMKFRYYNKALDRESTYLIDEVVSTEETLFAGQKAYVFTCVTHNENKKITFKIRYTLSTCIWVLYQILNIE